MKRWKWIAGPLLGLAMLTSGHTQPYPSKAVRLVIGFAPGGGTDIIGRLVADKLSGALNQSFVVENKPGATGMIGSSFVANADPDGYTLLMGHVNSQAIAPYFTNKPLYDPLSAFAPIAYIGYVPNVLVINPDKIQARTIQDLIALAKSSSKGLTYASPGVGSTNHLAGEMFGREAGIKLLHVPYKGSSPAIVDLLGGQIDMNFDAMSSIMPFVKDGKMRPIAITTPQRDSELPDVPTMAESGFKGFEVTNWYGIFAPAGTSPDIVKMLNGEINKVLAMSDVQKKLNELGLRRNPMSPEQFGEFLRSENKKYQSIAKNTTAG